MKRTKPMSERQRAAIIEGSRLGARKCVCGHPSSRHTTAYPGVRDYAEMKARHDRGEAWCNGCSCVEFREVTA